MKLDYIFGISGKLPELLKRSLIYTPFSPQNRLGMWQKVV